MSQRYSFSERAADVVRASQITVQVLLSRDNGDIELVPLRGTAADPYPITPEEFTARQLRCVAFVGLCGLTPRCAFREPLEPSIVETIAHCFLTYISVMLQPKVYPEPQHCPEPGLDVEGDSVAWLRKLWSLPDTRMN